MRETEKRVNLLRSFATVSSEMQNRFRVYNRFNSDREQLRFKIEDLKSTLREFGSDRELLASIFEEMRSLIARLCRIGASQEEYLRNVYNSDSFTLRVISGVGGREAEIFAEELTERYRKVLGRDEAFTGGQLSLNREEYLLLRFEVGVHRVQRVPVTESSGRLHTSTVNVSITTNLDEFNIQLNKRDLKIETMRSSGAGGQHVNTTSSAVRVTHLPTGLSCKVGTRRDQGENKKEALETVLSRVKGHFYEALEELQSEERLTQNKSRERSDKCRTYNFPQDRLTDHRVNLTQNNLKLIWQDERCFRDFIIRVRDLLID